MGGNGVTALAASPAAVVLLQSYAWQGHSEHSGSFENVALAATHSSSKCCTAGAERHPGQQGAGISTGAELLLHVGMCALVPQARPSPLPRL